MVDSWIWHHLDSRSDNALTDLVSALARDGLALVDGLNSQGDLLRMARSIATIDPHRDSDATGITTIADLGGETRSGFAGFSACALNPHTDRSGVANPPALLMMACEKPARSGGECIAIDGKAVYEDLFTRNPRAVEALSAPRSVLFGGATGHLGSVFTGTDGYVTIRLRLDDLADFSPDASQWLPVLRAAIDRHAMMFSLTAGQGYVLDNHRWLHGRRAFNGQRVMYRINGNPLTEIGTTPGFRPFQFQASSTTSR